MKLLAHRSLWLQRARTITITRIRHTQDPHLRTHKQVHRIRALLDQRLRTRSQRMRVHQELRLLPIRVLLVQHRATVRQVIALLRLLHQGQHRLIQHQHIVLHRGQLLRTVHLLTVAHLIAPLRDLLHQARDLDAKQDGT